MTNEQFIIKVLSVAKIGLKYSKDEYALENYAELEKLGVVMLDSVASNEIDHNIFVEDLYPTPNLSVRIIVVNSKNEVLFVKEKAEVKWGVPGGWCDLFISPRKNAEKEVWEEAGIKVKTEELLAVFNRQEYRKPQSVLSDYVMYFKATITKDQEIKIGFEVSDAKFYQMDNLPELSTNNTKEELEIAWDVLVNKKQPHVD